MNFMADENIFLPIIEELKQLLEKIPQERYVGGCTS